MNNHELPCEEEFDKFMLKAERKLELQQATIRYQVRTLTQLVQKAFEALELAVENIDELG